MTNWRFFVSLVIIILGCSHVRAQSHGVNIDSLVDEIQFVIGDSWYVQETENGFSATYCRSCAMHYQEYLDQMDYFQRSQEREDFFAENLVDSVSYFVTVSRLPVSDKWSNEKEHQYFTELYQANDILKFNVTFETKWDDDTYESILANNNLLKAKILEEPLYKSNEDIFSDYRFWLPAEYWKRRTEEFNFFFERLPYSSMTIDASIFIEHNKPDFFCEPMLVDKSDPEYYSNDKNLLETERRRTLKIIALALGIHDYHVVN